MGRKRQLDGGPFGRDGLRRPDRLRVDEEIANDVDRKFAVAGDFEVERDTMRILKKETVRIMVLLIRQELLEQMIRQAQSNVQK